MTQHFFTQATCIMKRAFIQKMDSGYVFKHHMNDILVNDFEDETFNEGGHDSIILTIKFYNLPNLIFHYLPSKEMVKNIEPNRIIVLY